MKPQELFETYKVFTSFFEGPLIPQESKLIMAKEFAASLSPLQYSMACPTTRLWLETVVQAKITELQAEENDRTSKVTPQETSKKAARIKAN